MENSSLIYVAWTVVIAAVGLALVSIIYVIVTNHIQRKRDDELDRQNKLR